VKPNSSSAFNYSSNTKQSLKGQGNSNIENYYQFNNSQTDFYSNPISSLDTSNHNLIPTQSSISYQIKDPIESQTNDITINYQTNGVTNIFTPVTYLSHYTPPTPPDSENECSKKPVNMVSLIQYPTPISNLKFNRRNNPELEKRRVHFCNYQGCNKAYTKSSHLKAHQRLHTGTLFIIFTKIEI
jgi:hypothetical protein